MKTTIALIIVVIVGVCTFTGCLGTAATFVLAGMQSHPEEGWAKKAHLEKLMNHPERQLLTEDEKIRAAKNICALKHLDKHKNDGSAHKEWAKVFCRLKPNDKIYFYDWCVDCAGGKNSVGTSYLLVRDGKPFESVEIETRRDREQHRSYPIVERLH